MFTLASRLTSHRLANPTVFVHLWSCENAFTVKLCHEDSAGGYSELAASGLVLPCGHGTPSGTVESDFWAENSKALFGGKDLTRSQKIR